MPPLRVALFVEGSTAPAAARVHDPLVGIWNRCLADSLGIEGFDPVVPISKKHIVAMDPDNPPMSGAGEALDQLMVRTMQHDSYDAAVVAWDLVPAWNPTGAFCRWEETLALYRLLGASKVLPAGWSSRARTRFKQLRKRKTPRAPRARVRMPTLALHGVLALCMEPMFEVILTQDEAAIRRALEVASKQVKGWPSAGWGNPAFRHPDRDLLAPALAAVRRLRPRPRVLKKVRGDFRTNKSGWDLYLLQALLRDRRVRPIVLSHPICARLVERLR